MAKVTRNTKKRTKVPPKEEGSKEQERLTLEALDAVSSEDDDDDDDMVDDDEKDEWNAEARALRQAIADGAFDHLMKKVGLEAAKSDDDEDGQVEDEESDGQEESDGEQENESGGENESDSDDEGEDVVVKPVMGNGKALLAVTDELIAAKRGVPWVETFDVIPSTPLPFGAAGAPGNPLDIHDDLKREVAFYNMALEAVKDARNKCNEARLAFSRPEDFFAEMVKTDDHMAKVKDRLIFDTKKMDAVAQRKSNKEHKLRFKEAHSNKLVEKAKRKKDHFKAVDDWAKSAASNRGGALREDDDAYLGNINKRKGWTDRDGSLQTGPNRKRAAADKKYGHGGQKGHFKQNDQKSLNDMSTFNPRGNFAGGTKSKAGGGANRKGKRARDAGRASR